MKGLRYWVVESKLNLSMARFFKRLPVDKPVVRNNYTFQVVDEHRADGDIDPTELAWSTTMKGDEDMNIRPGWVVDSSEKQGGAVPVTPSTLWLRTERQTLRRLPRTGAIVFTIRVYQTRIDDLAKEPGVPGRMASAIRSWPDDVARYAWTRFGGVTDSCWTDTRQEKHLKGYWSTWMECMLSKLGVGCM